MKRIAMYPGTFDPITNGHHDLVRRAASIFDRVFVAIAANPNKSAMFPLEARVELARRVLHDLPNVEVVGYAELTVEFARKHGVSVVIRGLRAVSDFEFEFQLALMNRRLNSEIETVFMKPAEQYSYISSRLIKEVFALGGRVHGLVPDMVEARLRDKQAARV